MTLTPIPHKIFDADRNESLDSKDQLEKDRLEAKNALLNALHQELDDKTNINNDSMEQIGEMANTTQTTPFYSANR